MSTVSRRPAPVPVSALGSRRRTTEARGRRGRGWLIGLETFVGIGAFYGAWELTHGAWGLSTDLLGAAPFTAWTWPGLLLLVCVALPMSVAVVLEARRSSWAFVASLIAGVFLVGWIVVQVLLIGLVFGLQPLMFVAGVAISALAWWVHPSGSRDYYR